VYFHFTNTFAPYSKGRTHQFALQHLQDNAPLLLAYFRLYYVICWCIRIESDDKNREQAALVQSCFLGRTRPLHVRTQLPLRNLFLLGEQWLKIYCDTLLTGVFSLPLPQPDFIVHNATTSSVRADKRAACRFCS
jgi:hypothetical protein